MSISPHQFGKDEAWDDAVEGRSPGFSTTNGQGKLIDELGGQVFLRGQIE